MKKRNLMRSLVGALIGMCVGLVIILITTKGYFFVVPALIEDFENKTYDLRFSYEHQLRDDKKSIDDIIIVDIDERSLDKLGRYQQWPRSYHGHIIDFLAKCGMKGVGFDVLFFEEDKITAMNDTLVGSTAGSDITFHSLSFEKVDKETFRHEMTADPLEKLAPGYAFTVPPEVREKLLTQERLVHPFGDLARASKGLGFANAHPDPDGVNRQWPLFKNILDRTYPSLALTMAMHVLGVSSDEVEVIPGSHIRLGDKVNIPIHANVMDGVKSDGWMYLNYYGDMKVFRYIPYYDILVTELTLKKYKNIYKDVEGRKQYDFGKIMKALRGTPDMRKMRVPVPYFKDKIALVGASATGLMDLRATPISGIFPGVEIHATALQNMLTADFIQKAKGSTSFLIIMVLSILAGTIALRFKPYWGFLLIAGMLAGYLVIIYHYFTQENIAMELVRPVMAVLGTYMSLMVYRYLTEEREKKFIRGAFQQYLSPSVISQLTENPDMLKLGGEKKVLTAFFSDVAGFSTISEKLTPEGLVQLLNEYLTDMTEIVLKYEGTLDKFEGDAIIAFFGAPVSFEDHARRACLVSLEMQERLLVLREKWSQEPHWPEIVHSMQMRIGLNTGPMVVGNMGSKMRMDYTMMGDSVNLAARLEGANKQYGTYNMISEYTYEAAKDHIEARVLDKIRVVGKSEPVEVYELLARKGDLTEEDTKLYGLYNEGIGLYRNQQWDEAIFKFKEAVGIRPDEPSNRYVVRCEEFKQNPPEADWDGVYTLTSK